MRNGKKFNPPDAIGLNELRVEKRKLESFQITKFYFSPNHTKEFLSFLHRKDCIIVRGGSQLVYVMRTNKNDSLKEDMPSHLSIEIGTSSSFSELPREIARQFLFGFIEVVAKRNGYIRGEGWQFYSPDKQRASFPNGHFAANIGIREESNFYSIFVDPATLVLVPLINVRTDYIEQGRLIRRLIAQEDKFRLTRYDFSTYPGRAGFFDSVKDLDASQFLPETLIRIRPRKNAENFTEYPAFALRLVAKRSEFEIFNINQVQARKQLQPLPSKRLKETKYWISKLFPNNQLEINDRGLAIENRSDTFENAVRYSTGQSGNKNLYYFNTPLLFDSKGTQTEFSQKSGLKKYKPFDSGSPNRPFRMIRPYLIIPGGDQIFKTVNQFMDYLHGDYQRRNKTLFPDDDFEGLKKHFDVEFDVPDENDVVIVEDATKDEYLKAAERILHSWATENGNKERIAIVIVPDIGQKKENDPYIPLKKFFLEAGLPSQMLEISSLDQVTNLSIPFGHTLWNFALDLYVKLGGKPWTLARPINNVNCLIGLGFGRSPRKLKNPIYVGIANVFDKAGQWIDLNSDDHELTNDELQSLKEKEQSLQGTSSFKLHHDMTSSIISSSLNSYNASTNQIAQKVVFHKNGDIYESEGLGFLKALSENILRNDLALSSARFALVSIYKNHELRMYGPSFPGNLKMDHTITKGSVRIMNENTALIATTGKNPAGYFGIGTPTPLIVQRFVPTDETFSITGFNSGQMFSIEEICEHILSLTRLHWGATNDIHLPITSEYAQRIAEFLAKTEMKVDFLLRSKRLWWI